VKAYRVSSDASIAPFGDHPSKCLIVNRPLADWQREVTQNLGLDLAQVSGPSEINDPAPHVIFNDTLFFSRDLLAEFVERSRSMQRGTRCALKKGVATVRTVVNTQDVQRDEDAVEYPLRYTPEASARSASEARVTIEPDEFIRPIRMPRHVTGSPFHELVSTSKLIVGLDHWVNLWAVNMGLLAGRAFEVFRLTKLQRAKIALKARSLKPWTIYRRMTRVGRNCDIHPTACVENSVLGDNVVIGAGAFVRNVVAGDKCQIGCNATVELSVLGEGCFLVNGVSMTQSVLYPGTLCNARFMNACLCGRDCFTAGTAAFADFRFDGKSVSVKRGGVLVDTEQPFLGSCLGHNTYVGSGCIIGAGHSVANGQRLVAKGAGVEA
jgi:carbonic anhydrase/acetyltransferase-like protein (isoleucine patch superfamily)